MPLSLDPLENTSIRLNDPRVSIRTNSNSYSSPWDLVPRSLIRLSTTRTNPLINCIVVWVVNILSVTNDPNLSLRTYPNVFSSYVIFVVHDPLLAIELEDTPNFVHYPSNSWCVRSYSHTSAVHFLPAFFVWVPFDLRHNKVTVLFKTCIEIFWLQTVSWFEALAFLQHIWACGECPYLLRINNFNWWCNRCSQRCFGWFSLSLHNCDFSFQLWSFLTRKRFTIGTKSSF